ncbi:PaaI family thioesterase [Streptomyces triticagri]|uniref:PaaI family thioesterase n=1 Tax=Streptomyces triticagri TaxID=2293568 RepID=A0A372M954_9ACTN|nr:PaaI family thioesterase [Streptomyces triticagri]RFU87472.1 PaaI family thioesterase [Streptomyces triticagri]
MSEQVTRTHSWIPPLPAAEMVQYSGEKLMRECLEGRLPPPPIASTLGIRLVEVGHGSIEFEGESDDHLINGYGTLFGGYFAALLDCALSGAVLTRLPAGTYQTTVQLNTHMVRPARPGIGPLRCTGRALHVGRSIATAEGSVTSAADGKLLAHATATCAVITPG